MKKGFTLAEVLITLGIIGVVAAMTLPTLVGNYQKQVYVNQLKKSFSVISQGFQLAMAKDGVMELEGTQLIQSINGIDTNVPNQDAFSKEIRKVFNVIESYEYDQFAHNKKYFYLSKSTQAVTNETKGYSIVLKDGSIYSMGWVAIDVNGEKGPNTWGRDMFTFEIDSNGRVYPASGVDASIRMRGAAWN